MHISIAFPLVYSAAFPAHQEPRNAPHSSKMHFVNQSAAVRFFTRGQFSHSGAVQIHLHGEEAAIMSRHDSRTAPRSILRKHPRNDLEVSPTQPFF